MQNISTDRQQLMEISQPCFHCGEPLPEGNKYDVLIDGMSRPMCCRGCQAVAQTLIDYGLTDFYRFRTAASHKADEILPENLSCLDIYDDADIQETFVDVIDEAQQTVSIILEDIVCPACCWLIERQISLLPGVLDISVNYSTQRAIISWDKAKLRLSEILRQIKKIGYTAYPYDPGRKQAAMEAERKAQLRRIGLSGLLGMQVMMLSIALYFGENTGMAGYYRTFFHWIALLLTIPVVFYAGQPFFIRAWRDISLIRTGMDVPISLAIGIAFVASTWTTLGGTGAVYFDSVVMFIFLLLTGRYLEFMMRMRSMQHINSLERVIPATATRLLPVAGGFKEQIIASVNLQEGDRVLVLPGATVPADGHIIEGKSSISDAIITGESNSIPKGPGESVIGGSTNIESPFQLHVDKVGEDSVLSQILQLVERGAKDKPAIIEMTHKIAAWFVFAVILAAALVAWYWHHTDATRWLPITLSVLIVSCPCALSLATPTAVTAALSSLMQNRIAVVKPNVLETLAQVSCFVFDKTGTLTDGRLTLEKIDCLADTDAGRCHAIAAAIEKNSEHPVARAIVSPQLQTNHLHAEQIRNYPGEGINALVDSVEYFLGSMEFITRMTGLNNRENIPHDGRKLAVLADKSRVICKFYLSDEIRNGAPDLMAKIRAYGKEVCILSGDNNSSVSKLAADLNIDRYFAEQLPQQKMQYIKKLQREGHIIAMTGDGINDAPVMSTSHLSIAIGSGTDLAKTQADMILLSDNLDSLANAMDIAHATATVIKQNILWAVVYNAFALPVAALGYITPWIAALGMTLSSLLVVLNSSRLGGTK